MAAPITSPIKISDLIAKKQETGETFTAFEYYPPRTEAGTTNLVNRFSAMMEQDPMYGDMTWGAGGSTSDLTLELCKTMQSKAGMLANMHLTCTNMEKEKIDVALAGCKENHICNIVALRGDPPAGEEKWEATEGGFSCALDLVKYIRAGYGDYFCLSVAGYPEGHPNAIKPVEDESKLTESELTRLVRNEDGVFVCHDADYATELAYLKEKVDAGADLIITQMFFEVEVFDKFVNDCRAVGIAVPILPGIMLIQNYGGFKRMTKLCKSRVPQAIHDELDAIPSEDKEAHQAAVKAFGIKFGIEICKGLLAKGHKGLHLYTLNLEAVTYGVLEGLGLKKESKAQ